MDNDELRLREQEIDGINNKIKILEEEIKDREFRKEENKKDIKFLFKIIPFLTISRLLYAVSNNSFDFYTVLEMGLKYLATYTIFYGVISVIPFCFYMKNSNKIDKLNVHLDENNELLQVRTNYLNKLKDKNNEKELENTNDNLRNINNSNSFLKTKTSGKTRIRKR